MTTVPEEIERIIHDQLQWDERVDASNIFIEVTDRYVRLTGKVASFEAWSAAWRNAANVVGVVSVDNQLRIEHPPALPAVKYR
ncbi:MAG: BON domain-containing protein [Dehalococcoidia bacterium]